MDKTALLKKVRALAEHGVGGETENAEKLLARMMKKYGISEEELDEETRVRHDFTYHGGEEKKILRQVVYKVTGGYAYELVYTASGRKVRTQLGADCTPAEKVEIEYLSFSKLLVYAVLYIDYKSTMTTLDLCRISVANNYTGSLPYLTALIAFLQAATATVLSFSLNKSKAENTTGGITYDTATKRDC